MKLHIITIGEPKLSFAKEGFTEYVKRLGGYHKVRVTHVKENREADKKLLEASGSAYTVFLDEGGKQMTSKDLSLWIDTKALDGNGEMAFVIGGPDGFSEALKEKADFLLSLSLLTLPHDMAMVVLAEALYRASTISAGHPYHRK